MLYLHKSQRKKKNKLRGQVNYILYIIQNNDFVYYANNNQIITTNNNQTPILLLDNLTSQAQHHVPKESTVVKGVRIARTITVAFWLGRE